MTILKTIGEKVKKLTPQKLIRKTFQENVAEMFLLGAFGIVLLNLFGVALASTLNNTNYFKMTINDMPDFLNPLITMPISFLLISPILYIFFYKITKKNNQKEMYIVSEDEILSFIKEYNEKKFRKK